METEHLLKAILDSISEGVMTLNSEWKVVLWNNAAVRITGFRKEEVLGRECRAVFRSKLCGKNCLLDRALSCGHPFQDVEAAVHNRRNQLIHLLVTAEPLYDSQGNIIGGLETFRDVSKNIWMQEELEDRLGCEDLVGRSQAMVEVFQILSSLVDTDTTVLIQGESGTGKELIARALHHYGNRRDQAFVALNCSAIPEGMLESELFGYTRGAFTGAVRDHMGKLELANGGTLFLDEIGEISPSVQIKLLRVIEEREFQRLGDNKTIKVDIRLITATNTNLYRKVLEGSFRADLYYRLSVYPVDLPPLRARIEDIPLLVSHFIMGFNKQMGRKIQGTGPGVLEILESHPWYGNIRELRNAIEHAFVHCKTNLIQASDLPQKIVDSPRARVATNSGNLEEAMASFERELILDTLRSSSWKKGLAAKRLGISLSTLWRRMEKYGLLQNNFNSERIVSILNDHANHLGMLTLLLLSIPVFQN